VDCGCDGDNAAWAAAHSAALLGIPFDFTFDFNRVEHE
jgi:hypothetical protein